MENDSCTYAVQSSKQSQFTSTDVLICRFNITIFGNCYSLSLSCSVCCCYCCRGYYALMLRVVYSTDLISSVYMPELV